MYRNTFPNTVREVCIYLPVLLACKADPSDAHDRHSDTASNAVHGYLHLVVSELTILEECRLLADVSLKASCKVTPLLTTVLQSLPTCDHQNPVWYALFSEGANTYSCMSEHKVQHS